MTKAVKKLTKLVREVLMGQRLQGETRRRVNCFYCGQHGHYKSKCSLRVKKFTSAADTGILGNDLLKENHCCLDVDPSTLKINQEVFLLRTEGTGSCCQGGVSDYRKGVCFLGLTDKKKVADEDQEKEDCWSLLTKSEMVI